MVIVSACLGGLAGAVAQGRARLGLSWVTNDGENQQCTFQISGTESKTVQSDANGSATVELSVGTYTVHVVHSGEYLGDDDKSITLSSRQVASLIWFTGARQAQTVLFTSPGKLSSTSVSYSIKSGETEYQSGTSVWDTSMQFSLYPGSYTLTLNAYGDSFVHDFVVPKNSGYSANLADNFCKLTVSSSYNVKNITFRGYTASDTSSYAASHSIYVIRSSKTGSVGCTVNTPSAPSYSGVLTGSIYSWSVSSVSITPNSATKSATISCSRVGTVKIASSGGSITIPSAKYRLWVIGGGGGGYSYGGGGSGYYAGGESVALDGTYTLKIGAGGAVGKTGGASSLGTAYSASGGSIGTSSSGCNGGDGGAGGGAGGSYSWITDSVNSHGGRGSTCGGGGEGAGNASIKTGGSYGGSGGKGAVYYSSGPSGPYFEDSTAGSSGKKFPGYSGSYSGGSRGTTYAGSGYYGGGGGGGGYGASGGNGGNGGSVGEYYQNGGGGGGGGMYGGNGGNAASGSGCTNGSYSFSRGSSSGRGYGAGGGGRYYNKVCGGGGAGGLGSTKVASDPTTNKAAAGAAGAMLIQWVSD